MLNSGQKVTVVRMSLYTSLPREDDDVSSAVKEQWSHKGFPLTRNSIKNVHQEDGKVIIQAVTGEGHL